jgi:hypothetical protein
MHSVFHEKKGVKGEENWFQDQKEKKIIRHSRLRSSIPNCYIRKQPAIRQAELRWKADERYRGIPDSLTGIIQCGHFSPTCEN